MGTDPASDNTQRSSALAGTDQQGRDQRRRSGRAVDEQIEAGFRKVFEDGLSERLEMRPGEDSRVLRARKAPRQPLNGTPPFRELD